MGARWGPKAEMLKIVGFDHYFLRGQEGHEYSRESLQPSERSGWEGVGGGFTLPLVGLFRGFRVWRVCCLVGASTCLEAQGLGGFHAR